MKFQALTNEMAAFKTDELLRERADQALKSVRVSKAPTEKESSKSERHVNFFIVIDVSFMFKNIAPSVGKHHTHCSNMSHLLSENITPTVQTCHIYCPKTSHPLFKHVTPTVRKHHTHCSNMSHLMSENIALTVRNTLHLLFRKHHTNC